MNTATRVRAAERNRRIFFPSERPAAPARAGLLPTLTLVASRLASCIQRVALRLRGWGAA